MKTAASAALVFTGDASEWSREGNVLRVKCRTGPGLLDSQLPVFIRGTMCSHLRGSNKDGSFLIAAGCTLLKTNWKFTAKVGTPVDNAYPYALALTNLARVTGAAPTYFVDWFAPGVIEWGTGADIQRRQIIGSTVPSGAALIVTLHRYFNDLPVVGDDVVLYPGCDGVYTTCDAYDATTNLTGKFDNFLNFGGSPFIPAGNPSVTAQPNIGTQGGKK